MSLVLSASAVVDSFAEIGVVEAIIHNPRGKESAYINAAWWLAFGRSLGLYAMIFMLAPLVATWYKMPALESIMRVALLNIICSGAISANAYIDLKEMRFKLWSVLEHGTGIIGTLVTIGLAVWIGNVWALAIGLPIAGLIKTMLSYWAWPFRPSLTIDGKAARELLSYSKGVFGLSFLNLLFSRTDVVLMGRMYKAADLGIYSLAVYLVQVPASFALGLLSRVLMPALSQMQGSPRRVSRVIVSVTATIVLLATPITLFVTLSGRGFLSVVYGERYSAGFPALAVACLVAIANVVNGQLTTVLYALGVPHCHRKSVGIMAILMVVLAYPSIETFGMAGGQISAFVAVVIGLGVQVHMIRRLVGLDIGQYLRSFGVLLVASVACLAVAEASLRVVGEPGSLTKLTLGAVVGLATVAIAYPFVAKDLPIRSGA